MPEIKGRVTITVVGEPTAGTIRIAVHNQDRAARSRAINRRDARRRLAAMDRRDPDRRQPAARRADDMTATPTLRAGCCARHVVAILRTISTTRTTANSISCSPVLADEGPNSLRSIKPARLHHAARWRGGLAARGAGAAARDAGDRVPRPQTA